MLKKIFLLFIPFALLFSQNNQQQQIEDVKEIDLLSSDKVEAETRYSMFYI